MPFFKLFSIAIILFTFISCKSQEKKSKIDYNNKSQNSVTTKNESSNKQNQYRFIVSFYSKGNGTDSKLIDKYTQFIKEFELNKVLTLSNEIIYWGKEGETDFCFKLENLNQNVQNEFITESKALLKESDLVFISENTISKHKQ
jgi:hypothetical protein